VEIDPLQTGLWLFVASLAGALLPLYRRWSEGGLHLLVSVSCGIFLGTVFLHLLPHLAGAGHADLDIEGGDQGVLRPGAPWIAALAGLLLLFAVRIWLRSDIERTGSDPHAGLWTATFLGLSLHSITTGVALTVLLDQPEVRTPFLISILIHKATESFSLATVMRLARVGTAKSICLVLLFATIEPAGLLFGSQLAAAVPGIDGLLTGFAAGTFLYVAVCDLVPEVFHGKERTALKLVAVAVGVLLTAVTISSLRSAFDFAARLVGS
jgi:zinc transporter ZupT